MMHKPSYTLSHRTGEPKLAAAIATAVAGCGFETLESRQLMSATTGDPSIADAGAGPAVMSLSLVNASTGKPLAAPQSAGGDGGDAPVQLKPADARRLAVRVAATGGTESVVFEVDGKRVKTDSEGRYSINGRKARLGEGTHTLRITPYSLNRGRGEAGESSEVTFTVNATPAPAPSPRTQIPPAPSPAPQPAPPVTEAPDDTGHDGGAGGDGNVDAPPPQVEAPAPAPEPAPQPAPAPVPQPAPAPAPLPAPDLGGGDVASSLWGENGERFDPAGRIIDYSFAGYHSGEDALPTTYAQTFDVRDHGAVGDGKTDDSQAFLRAINAAERAAAAAGNVGHFAVVVPEGNYLITQVLRVRESGVVIKGAGSEKSLLRLPKTLGDILGSATNNSGNSQWGANGGMLWFEADTKESPVTLTDVTADAKRGDHALTVADASGLSVGQRVRLNMTDDKSDSLVRHLYGDLMNGGSGLDADERVFDTFSSRIVAINGKTVELERALPVDVKTGWKPVLRRYAPAMTEVGVEGLSLMFADERAGTHHKEAGANGIAFEKVAQSWIRDVRVHNPDSGVFLADSSNVTATGIRITSNTAARKASDGWVGHHAFETGHSADLLITDFTIEGKFRHAMSFDRGFGNVYADGSGTDMNMGLHRRQPFSNLFTNLDLGKGTIAYLGSGRVDRGPRSGAFTTYWNIRADKDLGLPPTDLGPKLTFVGVQGSGSSAPSGAKDWFVESIAPADLNAPNLYEAQLARRLGAAALSTLGSIGPAPTAASTLALAA